MLPGEGEKQPPLYLFCGTVISPPIDKMDPLPKTLEVGELRTMCAIKKHTFFQCLFTLGATVRYVVNEITQLGK